jgi:hypothetical protein
MQFNGGGGGKRTLSGFSMITRQSTLRNFVFAPLFPPASRRSANPSGFGARTGVHPRLIYRTKIGTKSNTAALHSIARRLENAGIASDIRSAKAVGCAVSTNRPGVAHLLTSPVWSVERRLHPDTGRPGYVCNSAIPVGRPAPSGWQVCSGQRTLAPTLH